MDHSVVVHDQWQDPFFRIPNDVIDNQELNPYELSVLVVLRRYANNNPNHQAWPSSKTISKSINCSETTVKKAINSLIDKHYLIKENRFGDNGSKTSNVYTLINPYPHGRQTPMGGSPDAYTHGRQTPIKKNYIYKEQDIKINTDDGYKKVVQFYEANFGLISSHIADKLTVWIEDMEPESIVYAMEITTERNKSSFGYAESILKGWFTHNIRTREQAEKYEAQRSGELKKKIMNFPYKKRGELDEAAQQRIREAREAGIPF